MGARDPDRAGARLVAIDHVQLAMPAGDDAVAAAEAFYGGLLGLAHVEKPPALAVRGGCWFRGDGVEVHLGVEEPFRPARKAHPAFVVAGYRELCDALVSAGVEVRVADDVPGVRRAHVDDPFGNRIELVDALDALGGDTSPVP